MEQQRVDPELDRHATYTRAVAGPGANGFFNLTSGAYTVTASGRDATGATACQQAGTKQVTMTGGDLTVTGQGAARTPPYDYQGSLIGLGPQSMTVTLSACPDPTHNGTQVPIGLAFTALDTQGSKRSADGIDFTGASSQAFSPLTVNWNWALRGSP